jgi:hypothetical protein
MRVISWSGILWTICGGDEMTTRIPSSLRVKPRSLHLNELPVEIVMYEELSKCTSEEKGAVRVRVWINEISLSGYLSCGRTRLSATKAFAAYWGVGLDVPEDQRPIRFVLKLCWRPCPSDVLLWHLCFRTLCPEMKVPPV